MTTGSPVTTEALRMTYRIGPTRVVALDGIDLFVPAGQLVVVRGRSGSGKTTLLHLIAGLQRPTEGRVAIGDARLDRLTPREADLFRRRHIGLVFQFFHLIPSLTVEMNVALPLLLEGRRLRELRDEVGHWIETLGLVHRRHHAPHELSGGEMQRVAIARALLVRPAVILADEPTGNLDSRMSHEIFLLLQDHVRRRGVTTIVMTHEMDATSYADRVIEMRDGRILDDSGPIRAVAGTGGDGA